MCSPTFPERARVGRGGPGKGSPGRGAARCVRTHDGEQHVVEQQRQEHDEQNELPRVAALQQPTEQRQLAQGHGSAAGLRARRAVRGRGGPGAASTRNAPTSPGRRSGPGAARSGRAGRFPASHPRRTCGGGVLGVPALRLGDSRERRLGPEPGARRVPSRSPPPPRSLSSERALGRRRGTPRPVRPVPRLARAAPETPARRWRSSPPPAGPRFAHYLGVAVGCLSCAVSSVRPRGSGLQSPPPAPRRRRSLYPVRL